jgi:hypothetical protein
MIFLDRYLYFIQELVSIPGGSEEVVLYGKTFYTSQSIKNNIKKISKDNFPSSISSIISKLVDEERLIPLFISKNLFQHLFNKSKYDKLGHTLNNKAYVFLDPKIIFINEKQILIVIVHELIHLAEHSKPKDFAKINHDIYISFYKEFFFDYLQIKERNKVKEQIFENILSDQNNMRKKENINYYKLYLPVFKSLESFTSLSDDDYSKRFNILIDYLDESHEKFIEIVPGEIFITSKKVYTKLTGKKNETVGQEFRNPDEIIAVISELNIKHPNIIKTLELI